MGLRLAFGGAISEAALDYEAVARYGATLLLDRYPDLLLARYKLKTLPATGDELLTEIGKRRGCLRSGGVVDLHKAADVLIHDFREGKIGRISLETPSDVVNLAAEDAEAEALDSEFAAEEGETEPVDALSLECVDGSSQRTETDEDREP
jgi:ribosome biogenesis GTPase A